LVVWFGLVGLEFELKQGFALTKQALYHLSHTSSPFCSGYFGDGGLANYLLGLALNLDLLQISASQVAGIIGVSLRHPIVCFLDAIHFDLGEMESQCSFDLHFPEG
jgi:hypothetical protein